jgi:hypothetical protein
MGQIIDAGLKRWIGFQSEQPASGFERQAFAQWPDKFVQYRCVLGSLHAAIVLSGRSRMKRIGLHRAAADAAHHAP